MVELMVEQTVELMALMKAVWKVELMAVMRETLMVECWVVWTAVWWVVR